MDGVIKNQKVFDFFIAMRICLGLTSFTPLSSSVNKYRRGIASVSKEKANPAPLDAVERGKMRSLEIQ